MKKIVITLSAIVTLALTGCATHAAQHVSNSEHKAGAHAEHAHHWNYEENGPAHWEEFSKTCGVGEHQSPINIIPGKTVAMNHNYDPTTKQIAVIAVFFKEGKASPILDTVINNVGKSVELDPKDLLPEDEAHYYHYIGSLTTPPCSENVQWYLLKTPQTASAAQIEHFRKYYVDNERPVQELHDREVESN